MDRNDILKLVFIFVAFTFLITFFTVPKTHCDACAIEYEGRKIDGHKAWDIFEEDCISYAKPWDSWGQPNISEIGNITVVDSFHGEKEFIYVDIECINSTYDVDGMQIISIDWECAER